MRIDSRTPNAALLQELGRRLARQRKLQGFTQEVLAERAGIGVATLRRIEDGRDGRLGTWVRVLRVLDLLGALDELLPEEVRSPREEVLGRRRRPRPEEGSRGFVWGDERE